MRLLVFLHGTVLMHAGGAGVTRAERVAQVRAGHPTVGDFARLPSRPGARPPAGEPTAMCPRVSPRRPDRRRLRKHRLRPDHLPQIPSAVRARIKSIIIPEFGGIDRLLDNPQALLTFTPPGPTSPETAQSAH